MRRDVQEIFRSTPHEKQVMMFSATLSKDVRPVCKKFMQDVRIQNHNFFKSSFYLFRALQIRQLAKSTSEHLKKLTENVNRQFSSFLANLVLSKICSSRHLIRFFQQK